MVIQSPGNEQNSLHFLEFVNLPEFWVPNCSATIWAGSSEEIASPLLYSFIINKKAGMLGLKLKTNGRSSYWSYLPASLSPCFRVLLLVYSPVQGTGLPFPSCSSLYNLAILTMLVLFPPLASWSPRSPRFPSPLSSHGLGQGHAHSGRFQVSLPMLRIVFSLLSTSS